MLLITILITIIWYASLALPVVLVLGFLFVIFDVLSDMIIEISKDNEMKRLREEQQRHDCKYCLYYRNGKCLTQLEKDCKENDYFVWSPKEKL